MALPRNFLQTRHRILPNRRTVTLTPQNPAAAAITVEDSVRRPMTAEEHAMMGVMAPDIRTAAFLLPAINATTDPKQGDKLTDAYDSSVWNVLKVDQELDQTMWRCLAIKQK